jgi:hypothetical protein
VKRYAFIAALALAAAQPLLPACSNATLKGIYGLDGSGAIYPPPELPVSGPFVRVGAVRFDGVGSVRYTTVSSYNGIVTDEPYEGAYTVKEDCSFVYKALLPPPINLPATFAGWVSENGGRVDYMLVDPPGAGVRATLIRQPREVCRTSDLFGTFTMISHGEVLPPHPAAGSFVRAGTMIATGDTSIFAIPRKSPGTFSMTATANYGGQNVTEKLNGTFVVQPDCTVRFDFVQPSPAGNTPSSFSGVVVNEDKQIIFMISTQSIVVSGTMTRQ